MKKNCHPTSDTKLHKGANLRATGYPLVSNLPLILQTLKHEIKYSSKRKKIGAVILALMMFCGGFSIVYIY